MGIVRIVKVGYRKPTVIVHEWPNLDLLMDVMIQEQEGAEGKLVQDLKIRVDEYGDIPTLGEFVYVMIKNDKIKIID